MVCLSSSIFLQCIIKQLLDSAFLISKIIKFSAFGSADNTYLDLEYSDLAVLAMFLANI